MQKYFPRSPNTLGAAEVLPRKADAVAISKGCLLRCAGQGSRRARDTGRQQLPAFSQRSLQRYRSLQRSHTLLPGVVSVV